MAFIPKDWRDASQDLTTPITAAALENLETRVTAGIPYESVLWHGAVGDEVADDTAAFQAALDAVEPRAGVAYAPPGAYKMTGPLTFAPGVSLKGAGKAATGLRWFTDLGAGVYALAPNAPAASGISWNNTISDLTLGGPSFSGVMGTASCAMDGLSLQERMVVERCVIHQFRAGVTIRGDHAWIDKCQITQNHHNLYWGGPPGYYGDHTIRDTDLAGCSMSSVFCHGDNTITDSLFQSVHMGLGPYGFLRETGTPTSIWIHNTALVDVEFEWVGNACFYGPNTSVSFPYGDSIWGLTILGGDGFRMDPAYKIPAVPVAPAGVYAGGEIRRSSFGLGGCFQPFGAQGTAGHVHAARGVHGCRFYNLENTVNGLDTAHPFFTATTAESDGNLYEADSHQGRIVFTTTAVAAKDVVEVVGNNTVKKSATGTFYGIAASAASANNYVAVVRSGLIEVEVTGSWAAGAPLILDVANAGKLKPATGAAGEYIVAVALTPGGPGLARCDIRAGG